MTINNWHETKLGDFVTLQRGHDLPESNRRPGNVPVIGSFGITGFHDTAIAKGPGVTVGRSGASFGVVTYSPVDYWPHNACLYVIDFHGNDEKFAYYFLKSLDFSSFNSGSAQPSLNRNYIHPIKIEIPNPPEQWAIAGVLGALDDKIELNYHMNTTLESMARAIFKEWFIDGAEDYETGIIGDLISEIKDRNSTNAQIRVFSAVRSGELLPSDEVFTKQVYSLDLSKYKKIQKYNFAYNPARVNIGSIGMLEHEKGLVSPVYTAFSIKKRFEWYLLFFVRLQQTKANIEQLCSGSVRQNLTFNDFASIEIPIPAESRLQEFNKQWLDLRRMIKHNEKESDTLASLRDSLLPKLMRGEVRVKEMKKDY